ncbi:MAG: leucyl aminopeptidase [Pseudomonadota bacterium]
MSAPVSINFTAPDLDQIATFKGRVALFVDSDGALDEAGKMIDDMTGGALSRLTGSEAWEKMSAGGAKSLDYPAGMAADAIDVVYLHGSASGLDARKAGASLAKAKGDAAQLVLFLDREHGDELALGVMLRAYAFNQHKTAEEKAVEPVTLMVADPDATEASAAPMRALAEGVFLTRDLTNEPANILTTTEFASRIEAMAELGLKITVLDEDELREKGMHLLLSVGHGSITPSKVAVMEWMGGKDGDAPLALVGKGVVFDTGGISLKPAGGMEDMTMDMGGAGVVTGAMHAIAARKAKANVVGVVGLVENMPSDRATRPGDVVTSMKGDTVEIINTDAEGRLVLADALWYVQETYKPAAVINLATLTGAIIIGLGHEKAGVFSNDDTFCGHFLDAAETEKEGAWRMPMGDAYDKMLKSRVADMKNVGGRAAGSITAAQFLQRFVQEDTPWIHLDIAGVARVTDETPMAPKGSTGWGVLTLNRLVADQYEG